MKTIKIFLASSEELIDDRNAFGNLVRRLDKIYEKRGIRIELFEWEDYDAAYNYRRKQDEYNDQIKASDMFLALFHTKAGKFTIEEFDIATEEFKKKASPKVYTYCKDLRAGELESPELTEFKERLFNEIGHYWSHYNNRDSMQLHFVMQLQLVETSDAVEKLKLEEGTVMLEDMPIARLDNLQFAVGNEAYQKISAELVDLPEKIEKARLRIDKYPDDEDLRDDLQQKLNQYNKLRDEFGKLQQNLFDTARRIAHLQGECINKRIARAIEAFERGDAISANVILDEAESDAKTNLDDYLRSREITEQKRKDVISSIVELQLKCNTTMLDNRITIDERIDKVIGLYNQLDEMAKEVNYDSLKYARLLYDYANFLREHSFNERAIEVFYRIENMIEGRIGTKHPFYALLNNSMGLTFIEMHYYEDALSCLEYALTICMEAYGEDHPKTISTLNNLAGVFLSDKKYRQAIEYLLKAVSLCVRHGQDNIKTLANCYNNLGHAYTNILEFPLAIEYFNKAIEIYNSIMEGDNPEIAKIYNNIGLAYLYQGKSEVAKDYHIKAIQIAKNSLGERHPLLATLYKSLGMDYNFEENYELECEQYYKALEVIRYYPDKFYVEEKEIMALMGKAKFNLANISK